MKKHLWTKGLLVVVLSTLAACTPASSSVTKVTIDFWHLAPVGSPDFAPTKAIINRFNESQDKYFVKGTGFSFWDYWDKIKIAISSRTAPDLGLSTLDDVPARASAGVLYNLSQLMTAEPEAIPLNQFYENQLSFARYNEALFAMPYTTTVRVLYYNLDLFAEAGLTEADVPTTWSELKTIAKQLDKVDNKGVIEQIGFDPTYGNATFHGWLWQNGLDFFDENQLPVLDSPEHAEILQWIKDFNSEYTRNQLTVFGDSNALLGINPFAAQRVAMMVETDGLHRTIKNSGAQFNYGVTYIPVPDDNGIRVNWGSGFSIEMYDNGKGTTEKKSGAWEFLKFLMSYQTQIDLATASGNLMSRIDSMTDFVSPDPILTKLYAEAAFARDKVYIPYAPSWHGNDWQSFYLDALNGNKTITQALADAKANYLQKRENYIATHGG